MALKNFIKENLVLVMGLLLPVLLVVVFFLASVLPTSLAVPPQYEMIFSYTDYNQRVRPAYDLDFVVTDGALRARVQKRTPEAQGGNGWQKLMAYDAKTQSLREISYDMAQFATVENGMEAPLRETEHLRMDNSLRAPDGYEFQPGNGYSHGMFFFWDGSPRGGAQLRKGAAAFKIPVDNARYYIYDIRFIGWVTDKK